MSGVILQVRGCDGMSTLQNDAAAYLQFHVSRIRQGGFPLSSPWFSSSSVLFSYGKAVAKITP